MSVQTSASAATVEHAPPEAPAPQSAPQSDLRRLAAAETGRAQLIEQLVAQGVGWSRADRVAEASVRRAKARRNGQAFYFADLEAEFDALCRSADAEPKTIENAKRRVWATAREIAEQQGCTLEEALFFCFAEGLHLHSQLLASSSVPADAPVGVGPH